ncbi:MAG: DEAD/DEAH box helicase [Candidatus Sericytochromatia bacterium]|nr:DEAD/DEAH box helicase [Candidatus Sericytochromatia bacterium]
MSDTAIPSFEELGVAPEIVASLAKGQILAPTPVQVSVLRAKNPQGDLIVQARTGSGKTLAFGLSFLSQINVADQTPQVLIIAPTRELATQVCHALRPLAIALGLKTETLTGGADMVAQLRGLRAGAHLIVGTPGRIVDHLNRGTLTTERLNTVVLDEGDQMLDLGFKDDLEAILDKLPEGRRTLLFSATMPPEMRAIAKRYMRQAETITVDSTGVQHADIEHVAFRVPRANKVEALVNVLRLTWSDRAMLFCRTKAETEEICRRLTAEGFSSGYLHGDLDQRERNRVLAAFRYGKLNMLVATEVAARGIDVPGVAHVINVDLPFNLDAYIHRSGRTGRAGQKGMCFSLCAPNQVRSFRRMLDEGRIKADWRDTPTPEAIHTADLLRMRESITTLLAETEISDEATALAGELIAKQDPQSIIAGLLSARLSQENGATYDLEAAISRDWKTDSGFSSPAAPRGRRVTASGDDPSRGAFAGPGGPGGAGGGLGEYARFRVNMGHRDHLHPGKLVNLMCTSGGITGKQIGAIRILTEETFFEVEATAASAFLKQMGASQIEADMRVEAVSNAGPMPYSNTPQRGRNGITRPGGSARPTKRPAR